MNSQTLKMKSDKMHTCLHTQIDIANEKMGILCVCNACVR